MSTRTGSGAATAWWSHVPVGAVVTLRGVRLREIAESLNPLPADVPAIVFVTAPDVADAAALAGALVSDLEFAALEMLPLWLPGAATLTGPSTLDRRAAQAAARDLASTSDHFGPYLAHLADAAVASRRPRADAFSVETRARGCARVIASAQNRRDLAVVVDLQPDSPADVVAAAADWVNAAAGIGVWLVGGDGVDRFPSYRIEADSLPDDVHTVVDRFTPPTYPPVAGHPHPASPAENRLFRMLDTEVWSRGREHNRAVRLTELSGPFTVDVVWRGEKVIVEIDGDDHRASAKFSADRSRDNQLQTHGYIVLRFTNEETLDDPGRVLTMIERALRSRRTHVAGADEQ